MRQFVKGNELCQGVGKSNPSKIINPGAWLTHYVASYTWYEKTEMGLGDFAYQRVTVTTQQINEGNGSARLGSSLVLVGSTRIRVDRPGITSTESDKRGSLLTWFAGSEKKNPPCAKCCGWLKPMSRHRSALLGTKRSCVEIPMFCRGILFTTAARLVQTQ